MFLSILTLLTALAAVFLSLYAVGFVRRQNKRALSLRRLAQIEAELTELTDAVASTHQMLKKLRSRIGMRDLRQRRKGAQGANGAAAEYDLTTEAGRTAARQALEAELALAGKLHARTHLKG